MSDSDNSGGFYVTARNVGFALSLITLTTIIFGGFSTVNSYAYKIDKIEQDYKSLSLENAKITDKVGKINDQLVDLSITLSRLEERLNARLSP